MYRAEIGASSEDIRLSYDISVEGEALPAPAWQKGSWYEDPAGWPSDREFERLYGGPVMKEPEIRKGAFTMEMSTMEMKDSSLVMKGLFKATEKTMAQAFGGRADYSDPAFKMMVISGADSPLRAAVLSGGGAFPAHVAEGMLEMANGHFLKGLRKMGKKKEK